MKTIRFSSSGVDYEAKVDDEDYARLSTFRWRVGRKSPRRKQYVMRTSRLNGKRATALMHREIIGQIPNGMCVDHINGNTLDNRRCNLRLVTLAQNSAYQSIRSDNTSGFKGVTYHKHHKKWNAHISKNGSQVSLGYFRNKEEAARAYDAAAIVHYGEFALTNAMIRGEGK